MKLENLKDLPRAECLLAMEVLWQSLSSAPSDDVIPQWHQKVLSARLAQLQAGAEKEIPWSEAKDQLRALTQAPPNH